VGNKSKYWTWTFRSVEAVILENGHIFLLCRLQVSLDGHTNGTHRSLSAMSHLNPPLTSYYSSHHLHSQATTGLIRRHLTVMAPQVLRAIPLLCRGRLAHGSSASLTPTWVQPDQCSPMRLLCRTQHTVFLLPYTKPETPGGHSALFSRSKKNKKMLTALWESLHVCY